MAVVIKPTFIQFSSAYLSKSGVGFCSLLSIRPFIAFAINSFKEFEYLGGYSFEVEEVYAAKVIKVLRSTMAIK